MSTSLPTGRIPLRCTCCQREILAELVGDTLFIRATRHGREHVLLIKIDKIDGIRYASPMKDPATPPPL
jgi:hypothetical protein